MLSVRSGRARWPAGVQPAAWSLLAWAGASGIIPQAALVPHEVPMIKSTALLAITCLALGCTHMAGGVAPSNVPINGPYTVVGPAKGSDCQVRLFGILPVSGSNNTITAVNKAQSSVPGANALINLGVDTWTHNWILWTSHCTEVKATAVTLH